MLTGVDASSYIGHISHIGENHIRGIHPYLLFVSLAAAPALSRAVHKL
jgi:hypothetical protein